MLNDYEFEASCILLWWIFKGKEPIEYPFINIPGYFKYAYDSDVEYLFTYLLKNKYINVFEKRPVLTDTGKKFMNENKAIVWGHRNPNVLLSYNIQYESGIGSKKMDLVKFQKHYKMRKYNEVEEYAHFLLMRDLNQFYNNKIENKFILTILSLFNFYKKNYKNFGSEYDAIFYAFCGYVANYLYESGDTPGLSLYLKKKSNVNLLVEMTSNSVYLMIRGMFPKRKYVSDKQLIRLIFK